MCITTVCITTEREIAMIDGKFAERLRKLCRDYSETYHTAPPVSVSSEKRMTDLLNGSRKPTVEDLVAISEDYDVSINYLIAGDELFPSLHQVSDKDAILKRIEELKAE